MAELRYDDEHRGEVLDYFWKHGVSNYEGKIVLKDAWVATHERIGYALIESENDQEVEKACAPLNRIGSITFRQVTSTDEI
jgi:hypothetical protein